MHHPTDRITHTTAFVTRVVEHWLEREIAQWVHPVKDRSDDPSHHERTRFKQSRIRIQLRYRSLFGAPNIRVYRYTPIEQYRTKYIIIIIVIVVVVVVVVVVAVVVLDIV